MEFWGQTLYLYTIYIPLKPDSGCFSSDFTPINIISKIKCFFFRGGEKIELSINNAISLDFFVIWQNPG